MQSADVSRDARLQPGNKLLTAIDRSRRGGAAVYFAPLDGEHYLPVPRLDLVPLPGGGLGSPIHSRLQAALKHGGGELAEILDDTPHGPGLTGAVVFAVAAAAAGEALYRGRIAETQATPALRRLAAAALRDLGGYSYLDVAWRLDPTAKSREHADREARRDIQLGRRLWASFPGAWPWSLYPDDKLPRPSVWPAEADVVETWCHWVREPPGVAEHEMRARREWERAQKRLAA